MAGAVLVARGGPGVHRSWRSPSGAWVASSPAVQAALGTPEEIRQLVEEDFAAYYSSDAAAGFAAQVWTNNAWVSALVLIAGAFFVLPAVYVLAQNAINVGIVGGLMVANGRGDVFFGLIAPHGLLELTAVFVAAGAGHAAGLAVVRSRAPAAQRRPGRGGPGGGRRSRWGWSWSCSSPG